MKNTVIMARKRNMKISSFIILLKFQLIIAKRLWIINLDSLLLQIVTALECRASLNVLFLSLLHCLDYSSTTPCLDLCGSEDEAQCLMQAKERLYPWSYTSRVKLLL